MEIQKKLMLRNLLLRISIKILDGLKKYYEDFHKVKFDENCSNEAVNLSKKYLLNMKLPDKAIDIIDEAGASIKINEKEKIKG